MITTEEYANQIREQKISEIKELLHQKRDIVNNSSGVENIIQAEKEYYGLCRKYLRLTGIIKNE